MTRNDERGSVARHHVSHCPSGSRRSGPPCQLTVTDHFAERDPPTVLQHRALEGRAFGPIEPDVKKVVRYAARELSQTIDEFLHV